MKIATAKHAKSAKVRVRFFLALFAPWRWLFSHQEALQIRQESGNIIGVAWMLECLGEVAVTTGAPAQAVQRFSIAHALRTSRNAPLSANDQQIFDQLVQQAHAALGEERFASAWHQGERLAQEQTNFAALVAVMTDTTSA